MQMEMNNMASPSPHPRTNKIPHPQPLAPQHQKLLTESAISPEVAHARGYRTVTVKAELKRLGFWHAQCRVPGLLIPIHDVTGKLATYQLRPEEPRTRQEKPVKYETAGGS
jgi:putative DNA primase/helicase